MNEVRDYWVELQVEEPGVITGNKQRIDVSWGKTAAAASSRTNPVTCVCVWKPGGKSDHVTPAFSWFEFDTTEQGSSRKSASDPDKDPL